MEGRITDANAHEEIYQIDDAFSKKAEMHAHAVDIHFMSYNFARIHQTLRITPAMAVGVTDHVWEAEEIVALLG